jgi:peptidoglycan/LPS O-acetylase OafA/YrhL
MSFPEGNPASHRIRELDGWRAISVLLVIFAHFVSSRYTDAFAQHGFRSAASKILTSGALGPKIFFVISGFVICRLLIMEEQRYGSVSLKGFYYRRAFRILPPLLTYIAAVALLIATGMIVETWQTLPYALAFLYDIKLSPWTWFVVHTWSLSVEEQFYLIFPAAWILTPARMRSRVVAGVFLLCTALELIFFYPPLNGLLQPACWVSFAGIALGVWMAIHEQRVRQVAARVPGIVIAGICVLLLYRPIGRFNLNPWEEQHFYDIVAPAGIGLTLMYSLERGKWLRAVLCSKPMQAIGVTSYGVYLWQQLFTGPLDRYTPRGMAVAYMLPLLLVIVPASYFFLEKPAMRLGRALSQRARKAASDAEGEVIAAEQSPAGAS